MRRSLLTALACLSIASPLTAEPYHFNTEECEFIAEFPNEPITSHPCDGGINKDQCYDLLNYTQVFGLDATVNVSVTCGSIKKDVIKDYTEELMTRTLEIMTQDKISKMFNTTFKAEEKYKIAGLVGEGQMGMTSTIFLAQLWIGEKSAFSLEAELTGEQHEEADKLFKDILSSIQYKDTETSDKSENLKSSE